MVSYSRLRPAMSRDDPRRLLPAAAAGAVGAALVRGGSVPVVLMLSPFGRLARVATDKEVLRFVKGRCLPRLRPAVSPVLAGYFGWPLKRFIAVVRPLPTMASTASAPRAMTSGS